MNEKKKEDIVTPHDRYFKTNMQDPKTAASFLKSYLPETMASNIDLENLTLMPGSFIDKRMKILQTDLLFKTMYLQREAYVYFLYEHKSYQDKKTGCNC